MKNILKLVLKPFFFWLVFCLYRVDYVFGAFASDFAYNYLCWFLMSTANSIIHLAINNIEKNATEISKKTHIMHYVKKQSVFKLCSNLG